MTDQPSERARELSCYRCDEPVESGLTFHLACLREYCEGLDAAFKSEDAKLCENCEDWKRNYLSANRRAAQAHAEGYKMGLEAAAQRVDFAATEYIVHQQHLKTMGYEIGGDMQKLASAIRALAPTDGGGKA